MSHVASLSESKQVCEKTGNCATYQSELQQQEREIDVYTANANQTVMTAGGIVGLIGLCILLTPFVKLFQRIQRAILPIIVIVLPVIVGLIGGAFVGFAISFSACYKQSCSPIEETAIFTIPIASLVVTVPLARMIYKNRQKMAEGISKSKPVGWIIVGVIIIGLAISGVVSNINNNNRNNESQKQYLRNL